MSSTINTMSKPSTSNNNIIVGLKTQVKRQAGLKRFNENVANHAEDALLNAWLQLHSMGVDIEPLVWSYMETPDFNKFLNIDSKLIGVTTSIMDYTDRKGNIKPAHFTLNGKYYGSINVYGPYLVHYQGNFKITKEHFKVQVDGTEEFLEDLFKPYIKK